MKQTTTGMNKLNPELERCAEIYSQINDIIRQFWETHSEEEHEMIRAAILSLAIQMQIAKFNDVEKVIEHFMLCMRANQNLFDPPAEIVIGQVRTEPELPKLSMN